MKLRLFLITLLFSACTSSTSSDRVITYFDAKTWVEHLVDQLEKRRPEVDKTWVYDHKTENKRVEEIDWEKELKLFLDADLNKSSFVSSYDSVKDVHRTIYRLKPGEDLPIKELTVVFDSLRSPLTLHCIRQSGNHFFSTGSEVFLSTAGGNLVEYEIRSIQKLLWFRPDSSFVSGKVATPAESL